MSLLLAARFRTLVARLAAAWIGLFLSSGFAGGLRAANASMEGAWPSTRLRFAISLAQPWISNQATGRVYAVMTPYIPGVVEEPRFKLAEVGMRHRVVVAADLTVPGKPVILDQTSALHPLPALGALPPGEYWVQAVLHTNRDLCLANAPGDFHGKPQRIRLDPRRSQTIRLTLDQQLPPETLPMDTDRIRYVKLRSELLTKFHGRPMFLRAAVLLPRDFEAELGRRYPLRVEIGGFGSRMETITRAMETNGWLRSTWLADEAPRFLWLQLDGAGPNGDPYWVNSENNGPYGDALVQELIPYVEATYRGVAQPHARVLAGGSTGGWVSFALQVFYPDYFNGCWSGFPDALDFRAMQLLDLYSHTNAYLNPQGFEFPSARSLQGDTLWTVRHEVQMENTLGAGSRFVNAGGQFGSWNAVYSPRGADGRPMAIWDPRTGAVDATVANHWKKYDLRLILETNWGLLGPKVRGKIHCWVGDADDYFLDGGVRHMKEFLDRAQPPAEASVRMEPRERHGWNPLTPLELLREMQRAVEHSAPRGAGANAEYLKSRFLHGSSCPHCKGGR